MGQFSAVAASARLGQGAQISSVDVSWAGNGAFVDEGMCMDDVDMLLEKAQAKKKGKGQEGQLDSEAGEGEEGDNPSTVASTGAETSSEKWFDLERHVAKSLRVWRTTAARVAELASNAIISASACIVEFDTLADKDHYKNELKIVRCRASALEVLKFNVLLVFLPAPCVPMFTHAPMPVVQDCYTYQVVANNAELPIDEARAKLNEYTRSLRKGGEVDTPGLDSGASTTCDALLKAGPSQGFDSIG